MKEFKKPSSPEEAIFLKRRLEEEGTFELFYQLIGRIISKHENIDKLLIEFIRLMLRDISTFRSKDPIQIKYERGLEIGRLVVQLVGHLESQYIRNTFCNVVASWYECAKKIEDISFNENTFSSLAKVLEFESKVRNIIAHSSFEYEDSTDDQLAAVFADRKKNDQGIFRRSTYNRWDLVDFCAFQNRLHLSLSELGGLVFERGLDIDLIDQDPAWKELTGDAVFHYKKFFSEEIPYLTEWIATSKILQVHSERSDFASYEIL